MRMARDRRAHVDYPLAMRSIREQTPIGGKLANGIMFSVNLSNSQFGVHSIAFSAVGASGTNTDGAFPLGDVTIVGNALYGTTFKWRPRRG